MDSATLNMKDRLVWAEIDLGVYAENIAAIKSLLKPQVKMMAVIKANAYGHGAVEIAKKAEKIGIDYFGVVCMYEAKQLREAGIITPMLILNHTDEESLEEAVKLDLSLNVMYENLLVKLNEIAEKADKIVKVHVKVDSGMHRLGLSPQEALRFIPKIKKYNHIALEGIFTHFATADEVSLEFTYTQLKEFTDLITTLKTQGINPPLIHAANSAATLRVPESHFTMVRPGIATYGLPPSLEFQLPVTLKPILSLKTQIVQVRKISVGESVGYGRTFMAERETIVAVLPVGYGDGFRRAPKHFGYVLVRGKKVPVIGRVSMDQTTIDVTDVPGVQVGDEVVIIGQQGDESITADDVAEQIGTINYEVVTSLAARVERIYI